jgi:hypothetical protein
VLLGGFLGFAWSTVTGRGAWASACVGGVAGLVLEAGQVLEVSRGPSITDVLDLGIAGYVGGVVHARYWRWRYSEEPD